MVHGPGISGLFKTEASPEVWESYALSKEQLQHFDEKGFVAGIPLLSEAECDALAADVDSLLGSGQQRDHPAKGLWYAFHPLVASGAWRISFAFHDLMWHPRFRVAAYQLLGGSVRFLHDQIFCKPPSTRYRGPSWFGFHQDFSYWSWTSPMSHLTCWVALDDATAANGCLQYVAGSHRWGLLPPIPEGTGPALDGVKSVLTQEQAKAMDRAERVELRKGWASFHHPLMLHGSDSNTTDAPRRAAVLNAVRDGVTSNFGRQPANLGSFPFIPQGEQLGESGHAHDRMYPLLLSDSLEVSSRREAAGPGSEVLRRLPLGAGTAARSG